MTWHRAPSALKRGDILFSITLAFVCSIVVYALWDAFGMKIAVVVSGFILLVGAFLGSLIIYRRLIGILEKQRHELGLSIVRAARNCYRQIEALGNVRSELNINGALPPMRGWAISPDFAELIVCQLKEKSPTSILECGSGVSTIIVGSFLKNMGKGHLVSLEHDAEYAERAMKHIHEHGLQDHVRVLLAPLTRYGFDDKEWLWYDIGVIAQNDVFDFVVVDGPPEDTGAMARFPLFRVMGDRIKEGAIVLLDDAGRPDEKRILERWGQDDPRLQVSTVFTEKGAAIIET